MRFFDCITDFIFVEDEPQCSDIIFVPGGSYPDAAEHAAELYLAGFAPYIMPSGRYSILRGRFVPPEDRDAAVERSENLPGQFGKRRPEAGQQAENTRQAAGDADAMDKRVLDPGMRSGSYETECDYLCGILCRRGVPERAILREDQATFTYENAICSRKRTEELGLRICKAILCCQAFHARRSLMYYQEQFPDTEFRVCPVVTKGISRENWHRTRAGIDIVLGEMERCGAQFHEILYAGLPGGCEMNSRTDNGRGKGAGMREERHEG